MNKVLKSSVLLTIPFLLSSCSMLSSLMENFTYKEVEYEEFHEKAVKAFEDVPYKLATVNGKMTSKVSGMETTETYKNVKIEIENGRPVTTSSMSANEQSAASYIYSNASDITDPSSSSISENYDIEVKFYVSSSGFKIVEKLKMNYPELGIDMDIDATLKYDKYAMCTSVSSKGTTKGDVTIKYSK